MGEQEELRGRQGVWNMWRMPYWRRRMWISTHHRIMKVWKKWLRLHLGRTDQHTTFSPIGNGSGYMVNVKLPYLADLEMDSMKRFIWSINGILRNAPDRYFVRSNNSCWRNTWISSALKMDRNDWRSYGSRKRWFYTSNAQNFIIYRNGAVWSRMLLDRVKKSAQNGDPHDVPTKMWISVQELSLWMIRSNSVQDLFHKMNCKKIVLLGCPWFELESFQFNPNFLELDHFNDIVKFHRKTFI